jgi:hypothetical protein
MREVSITDLFLLFLEICLLHSFLAWLDLISGWHLSCGVGLLFLFESFRLGLILVNLDLFIAEVY